MEFKFRGCNQAFRSLVSGIHRKEIPTVVSESRNGPVIRIPEPVLITFTNPRERVLFNVGRDCNPFFHLFESLYMLAGRNDVDPLAYYAENVRQFSDDGKTFNATYGHRWRKHFGWDQLDYIVKELKQNSQSRRVVLSMWDSGNVYSVEEEFESGIRMDTETSNKANDGDFGKAIRGCKDVSCNTHCYFEIVDNKLNMTVCNRSNDLVWGLLGANIVHFSFLLEYLACRIGVEVGLEHHFTNNLHIYTETNSGFHPEKWLEGRLAEISYADNLEDATVNGGVLPGPALIDTKYNDANHQVGSVVFDREVKEFIDDPYKDYSNSFLNSVAKPMCQAFRHHKARQYDLSREAMSRVIAEDWYEAGIMWLTKREKNWKAKNAQATSMESESRSDT